jgi:hypothetical protein
MSQAQSSATAAPARGIASLIGAVRALVGRRARPGLRDPAVHAALQVITFTDTGTHTMLVGSTRYGKGRAPAQPAAPATIIEGCVRNRAAL